MLTFKNILVAVDGSEYAQRAVEVASDLARVHGAAVTIIHVMPRSGSGIVPEELEDYARIEHITMTEHDFLQAAADKTVRNEAERLGGRGVTEVRTVVDVGDPARTIVAYAESHGVDAIVMGSRGLGDLRGLVFGSVSHKVGHLATCPCITVS